MLWENYSVIVAAAVLARFFLDKFSKKVTMFSHFSWKWHFGSFLFRRSFFGPYFRIMSNPSQTAVYSSRNKSQMAPNEKVFFHEKLVLRSKTWGKSPCFYCKSPVFEESMKERGSTYEHFPLCGSAWAAIWGRLLKKPFCTKHRFSENVTCLGVFGNFGFVGVCPKSVFRAFGTIPDHFWTNSDHLWTETA